MIITPLLAYLESIDIRNSAWAAYVLKRLAEVQGYVNRLRDFIGCRPGGRVACVLIPVVASHQVRIDRLRATAQEVL